jgi:hypothetical protein
VTHRDRTEVKRTSNEGRTKVRRKLNTCWMKRQDDKTVHRMHDSGVQDDRAQDVRRRTKVQQTSDKSRWMDRSSMDGHE